MSRFSLEALLGQGCGEVLVPASLSGVAHSEMVNVLGAAHNTDGTGWETSNGLGYDSNDSCSFTLFEYKGIYYIYSESSDYTGHGCQCSEDIEEFASLEDAVRLGLGDAQALALGVGSSLYPLRLASIKEAGRRFENEYGERTNPKL